MPSNKSFYEGSVLINDIVDNLDLSGWINRSLLQSASKGQNFIRINSAHTFTKGDIVMDALTNRFIGRVKEQGGPTIVTFEKPLLYSISAGSFIRVRPKFEIIKIEILTPETYILELVPVDRKHPGSVLPDRDSWSSNTEEDFGAVGGGGAVFTPLIGALVPSTIIEGRFQRVVIDNTGVTTNHAAMCYLKSAPTIM